MKKNIQINQNRNRNIKISKMTSDKTFELSELFIHDQPRKKYICQVAIGNRKCLSELSDANNTTIRKNHLKAKHSEIKYVTPFKNTPKMDNLATQDNSISQLKLENESIIDRFAQYAPTSIKYNELSQAILHLITEYYLPLSIVEHPAFIAAFKAFNSRYTMRYFIIIYKLCFKSK